jgi:hypothetical protein
LFGKKRGLNRKWYSRIADSPSSKVVKLRYHCEPPRLPQCHCLYHVRMVPSGPIKLLLGLSGVHSYHFSRVLRPDGDVNLDPKHASMIGSSWRARVLCDAAHYVVIITHNRKNSIVCSYNNALGPILSFIW